MRQGGLKPKAHNNGNYWVRASSKRVRKNKVTETEQEFSPMDLDHDGIVSSWEKAAVVITYVTTVVLGIVTFIFLCYLAFLGR